MFSITGGLNKKTSSTCSRRLTFPSSCLPLPMHMHVFMHAKPEQHTISLLPPIPNQRKMQAEVRINPFYPTEPNIWSQGIQYWGHLIPSSYRSSLLFISSREIETGTTMRDSVCLCPCVWATDTMGVPCNSSLKVSEQCPCSKQIMWWNYLSLRFTFFLLPLSLKTSRLQVDRLLLAVIFFHKQSISYWLTGQVIK